MHTGGEQWVAVTGSVQPTVARLQAQTAAGFIGSAVFRCPSDTAGSTSLWKIRQPSVCDRGLGSEVAIYRNGDWRRVVV